ncbi:hypothetical protein [Streptomyces sp. NPDC085479]|uniref:hypothetical protein n=1 Tax=Streptomyces sp. NPDC085479 TaxID=3365726 RepID=UPI0037D1AC45
MLTPPAGEDAADRAPRSWSASWTFTSAAGVTSGHTAEASYEALAAAVLRTAEMSLAGLPDAEADAMSPPWNRLVAAVECQAEEQVTTWGRWRYDADGWATVTLTRST